MAQSTAPDNREVFTAQAITGTSVVISMKGRTSLSWQYVTTGTPTTVSIQLEGSVDGTNFETIDAPQADLLGVLVLGTSSSVLNQVRLNLTALSGGSSPTVTANILVN